VEENAGQGIVTILRTNGSIGIASVRLTTANGTATAFADYTPVNRVVTFADGETVKTVAISVANDSVAEPDETVLLALSQPTGGATILTPTSTLTIFDDEVVPSYVGYAMTLFSVNETDGFATISVVRTNSRRGFFTVDFSVSDGSAIAGQDYVFTNGTLVFNDGENLKTFTVPILNDTVGEGVETISRVRMCSWRSRLPR
jgi:hypothetical protein